VTTPDDRSGSGRYQHFQDLRDEALARGGDRETAARAAANEWWRERVELSSGAEFRDDAPVSDAVYQGYSHEQLHRMVTSGLSGAQISEVSHAWSDLANALSVFAERLHEQARRTDAVWQGGAAESARTYVKDMSAWSGELGERAQLVSHQVSMHSYAARTAHGSMPPPQPFDSSAEVASWPGKGDAIATVGPTSLELQRASSKAKAAAVRVMNEYDEALRTAAERQPVFPAPPRLVYPPGRSTPAQDVSDQPELGATVASGLTPPPGVGSQPGGAVPDGSRGGPAGPGAGGDAAPGRPGAAGSGAGGAVAGSPTAAGPRGGVAGSGPTSRGGAPFMGMPGAGGRGQGGEDKEHRNKYAGEDHGVDDWFSGMDRPVNPVLGADPSSASTEEVTGAPPRKWPEGE